MPLTDDIDDAAASIDDGEVFWECVSLARDRDRVGGKHISVSRALHMVVGDDGGAGGDDGIDDFCIWVGDIYEVFPKGGRETYLCLSHLAHGGGRWWWCWWW